MTAFHEDAVFIDDDWTPTYSHPLLRFAQAPADAGTQERIGYRIGLFINPVFPKTLDDYNLAFCFRDVTPGSIKEGRLFRAWDWTQQRQTIIFARRRIGFDKKYAAFDVGVIDETGRVGLCICGVRGTEVTENMERAIKLGVAEIPISFWHAMVKCDVHRMTFVDVIQMGDVEKKRRDAC